MPVSKETQPNMINFLYSKGSCWEKIYHDKFIHPFFYR